MSTAAATLSHLFSLGCAVTVCHCHCTLSHFVTPCMQWAVSGGAPSMVRARLGSVVAHPLSAQRLVDPSLQFWVCCDRAPHSLS